MNTNCSDPIKASLADCVGNRTTKIVGDDTREIVDIFEDFLRRKAPGGPEEAPFMAVVWLHTNHEPHPVCFQSVRLRSGALLLGFLSP